MEIELSLRIVLEKPPTGVDFALQKGSGTKYEMIQKQRSKNQDLVFEFKIRAKLNEGSSPNFLGPFVQGNRNNRFAYLDVGRFAGQADSMWTRRLKIPLTGISLEMANHYLNNPNMIFETHVAGTGKDGGPNCGTVKPFNGWQLKK